MGKSGACVPLPGAAETWWQMAGGGGQLSAAALQRILGVKL